MILRLVRAQLRSEWRQAALGVGVLAFALAFATCSMFIAATALVHREDFFGGYGSDLDNHAWFDSVLGSPLSEPIPEYSPNQTLSLDEIEQLIHEASRLTQVEGFAVTVGRIHREDTRLFLLIPLTSSTFDRYLFRGEAPRSGQIALRGDLAHRLDLEVGDFITLESLTSVVPTTPVRLEISGILLSGDIGPYFSDVVPEGLVSWGDLESLQQSLPSWPIRNSDTGTTSYVVTTQVLWSGDNPVLTPYRVDDPSIYTVDYSWSSALSMLDGPAGWSLLISGVAVACLVAAALSMGRAQAESRTQWNATARVLGVSGRTIARASLVETAIVSIAGVAAGLGVGLGLANLHLVYLRAANPHGFLPSSISAPAGVFIVGAIVGLVLAVILAAIPAFWASRVAPVAALKPVTPVSQATLSRSVRWWWPLALTSVGVILMGLAVAIGGDSFVYYLSSRLSQAFLIVAGSALVIQTARGLVILTGRLLSRSRRPWMLAAGDGILANRQAFTFAALGTLTTSGIASWWIASNASLATKAKDDYQGWGEIPLQGFAYWWRWWVDEPNTLLFAAVAFAVVMLVAVVVAATFQASTGKDDSVRSALGLSRRGERWAIGIRQTSVMSAGAVAGALAGCAIALLYRLFLAVLSSSSLVYSLEWNLTLLGHSLLGAAAIAGIGLIFGMIGGMLTASIIGPRRLSAGRSGPHST